MPHPVVTGGPPGGGVAFGGVAAGSGSERACSAPAEKSSAPPRTVAYNQVAVGDTQPSMLNAGDDHAMAQAVHGTAPDIAGKGLANPAALILSTAQLLD